MSTNISSQMLRQFITIKSNHTGIPAHRLIAGLSGPVLLGFGSGISITAGFGSFGFSVLLDGLHQLTSMPLWLSQFIITVVFYFIAWFWGKIPLGIGTLPSLLLIGPAISLGATITPDSISIAGNLVAFTVGLVFFALGISLAAAAALGPDGITAVSLAAEKKNAIPVSRSNFVLNLAAIALGVSLGGNFGVATVVGLFVVPILIGQFLPVIRASFEHGTVYHRGTTVYEHGDGES